MKQPEPLETLRRDSYEFQIPRGWRDVTENYGEERDTAIALEGIPIRIVH